MSGEKKTGWVILAILGASMFVYTVDTTVMNVSISALVEDLDTTVGEVQVAITLYTLTMAAFMLTGGKLGDIWGSKRAFRIGLVIYGIGTTITALAPSIGFIILGWSILEGLGSALIVPAINTLVRSNYKGTNRAKAYGILFGIAAAGAAFGPLIGGWLTTNMTWRVAFAAEAIIVVVVLLSSGLLVDAPKVLPEPRLDGVGVVLSVSGMGMFVLGILQTTSRGWSDPIVIGLILGGLAILGAFAWWVTRRERLGQPALIHPSIFRHRAIRIGLPTLSTQTFVQAGLLFLVPLFAQSVLGLDAFETGLTLIPLSIAVLLTSVFTPPLGRFIYPRYIIQAGLVILFIGGIVLSRSLGTAEVGTDLAIGLLLGGIGIGLIAGQLPNTILSGADQDEASEASGLQGTALNLGMALGTAVVGTVILSVGFSSFGSQVEASTVLPQDVKVAVAGAMDQALDHAQPDALALEVVELSPDQQVEAAEIYETAARRGFQVAIAVGGFVALIGAVLAFWLPKKKLSDDASVDTVVKQVVRNPTIARVQFEMDDLDPSSKP